MFEDIIPALLPAEPSSTAMILGHIASWHIMSSRVVPITDSML